jgi:hypothetical protein
MVGSRLAGALIEFFGAATMTGLGILQVARTNVLAQRALAGCLLASPTFACSPQRVRQICYSSRF